MNLKFIICCWRLIINWYTSSECCEYLYNGFEVMDQQRPSTDPGCYVAKTKFVLGEQLERLVLTCQLQKLLHLL